MTPFEVFEHSILEALNHLYDPVYRPPESLWTMLNIDRESGLPALHAAILSGIEDLKPSPQAPLTARSWRIYGMLQHRYVDGLSQEVNAEKLGITARQLRRNFAEAIHALSMVLWEKSGGTLQPPEASNETQPPIPNVSWHEQLVRELETLGGTGAGAVSNVAETVSGVLRLATHLTKERQISLLTDPIPAQLMASIHPSALRSILISIIEQLGRQMQAGVIRLSVAAVQSEVQICLAGAPLPSTAGNSFAPAGEMLSSFNIGARISLTPNSLEIILSLILVDRCVLIIDDNPDMAHLYRRYLAGTRYYLQHANLGEKTFTMIDLHHPHIVVLDVMLPDIDGWELLTRLHENPHTRRLPVLVCSVMREKELAQALGARACLTKPVQRLEFIQALDTVLQPA